MAEIMSPGAPDFGGAPTNDPLIKEEYCRLCDTVLRDGARNMEVIQRCKRCGLPVEEAEATQRSYLEMAANIKREFFPHNT